MFGGSGFWVNKETGEKHYMAKSGDFICVSNFPTAMLDLPVEHMRPLTRPDQGEAFLARCRARIAEMEATA